MEVSKIKEILRIFLAAAVAFCIFIVIAFLSKTHKRITIDEALMNVKDPQLKACIVKEAQKNDIKFVYKTESLECPLEFNQANQPLPIKNFEGLELFKYLKQLDLKNSAPESLIPLRYLQGLEYLNLENSNIRNMEDIAFLIGLKKLDLYGNSINTIGDISSLKKLTSLNLEKNQIKDLNFIDGLKSLQELNMRSNLVQQLPNTVILKQLRILNLSSNNISDISALNSATNLRELYLFNNKIKNISALKKLSHLTILHLGKNQIEDISPLAELQTTKLILQNNSIKTGVDKLFDNLDHKESGFVAVIDLDLNSQIPCDDLTELKTKTASYTNITIIEPKACLDQSAVRRRYYGRRKKPSIFKRMFGKIF